MTANPQPKITILSPNSEMDFISEWYDLADSSHFWMRWRLLSFLNLLKRNHISLENPLHGFEIGCGHGVLRDQVEKNSQWTVDGTDLDLNSLKLNKPGKGDIFLYNIFEQQISLKDKYDFLFLFDVIEHIEDDKNFLEKSKFHLKNNGYIFINVPAMPSLYSKYDTFAGHQRRYTKKTLNGVLKDCNLEILDIQYWGLNLIPLLTIRKMILSNYKDSDQAINKGFAPPSSSINEIFVKLMRLENFLIPKPFLGTSLLAIARKKT